MPLRTLRALVRKMVFEGVLGQREFTEFQRVDKLAAREYGNSAMVGVDVDVLINLATTIMNGSTKTTNMADNQAEGEERFVAQPR